LRNHVSLFGGLSLPADTLSKRACSSFLARIWTDRLSRNPVADAPVTHYLEKMRLYTHAFDDKSDFWICGVIGDVYVAPGYDRHGIADLPPDDAVGVHENADGYKNPAGHTTVHEAPRRARTSLARCNSIRGAMRAVLAKALQHRCDTTRVGAPRVRVAHISPSVLTSAFWSAIGLAASLSNKKKSVVPGSGRKNKDSVLFRGGNKRFQHEVVAIEVLGGTRRRRVVAGIPAEGVVIPIISPE